MKKHNTYKIFGWGLSMIAMLAFASCERTSPELPFPPEEPASCTDGQMNQDEYRVDCGGSSCFRCNLGFPSLYASIDSTWINDSLGNPIYYFFQPDYVVAQDTFPAGGVNILAVDSLAAPGQYIMLSFRVEKDSNNNVLSDIYYSDDWEGVYGGATKNGIEFYKLEKGIVKITNTDTVNRVLSGTFEFVTEQQPEWVGIDKGQFTDVVY